jgi:hypothetical protein
MIRWTKTYDLNHPGGFFTMYISEHNTGYFYGAVLYYTKTGNWNDNTLLLQNHLEQFSGRTEQSVYDQCTAWINNNLSGQYNPVLRETRNFNQNP